MRYSVEFQVTLQQTVRNTQTNQPFFILNSKSFWQRILQQIFTCIFIIFRADHLQAAKDNDTLLMGNKRICRIGREIVRMKVKMLMELCGLYFNIRYTLIFYSRRNQNHVKHLRWRFLGKQLTSLTLSQMFDEGLNISM